METPIPFWLQHTLFTGRDDGDGSEDDSEGDDSEDDSEENEDEDQDSGSSDKDSEDGDDETAALKKALAEERKARRKAEREARKASKSKGNEDEKKTLEETQSQLAEERTKTERLAAKLLRDAKRSAILAEAARQKFIDPTDALVDDVLSNIEVDQDPDDPADIEVDEDTVKSAITKLANKKKHLIGLPGDGQASGGRFTRKKGAKESEETSDEVLKTEYPSLR